MAYGDLIELLSVLVVYTMLSYNPADILLSGYKIIKNFSSSGVVGLVIILT
jgi:hypothetical protein